MCALLLLFVEDERRSYDEHDTHHAQHHREAVQRREFLVKNLQPQGVRCRSRETRENSKSCTRTKKPSASVMTGLVNSSTLASARGMCLGRSKHELQRWAVHNASVVRDGKVKQHHGSRTTETTQEHGQPLVARHRDRCSRGHQANPHAYCLRIEPTGCDLPRTVAGPKQRDQQADCAEDDCTDCEQDQCSALPARSRTATFMTRGRFRNHLSGSRHFWPAKRKRWP